MSKKWIPVIISIIILVTTFTGTADAKSVYVIADTGTWETDTPIIQSYHIQDVNLVYQAEYNCVHPLAIGIAIDTDSEFLFVTHEEYYSYPGNVIELVNAKTMQYVDTVTATGASDLAGIVVDQGKQKVYAVDRETKYLYVYNWYPNIPELVQDGNRVELEGLVNQYIGGAWGIALDEQNHRLWVTSNTQTVRYYDTNDWSHDPNTDYITMSHDAVGISVDVNTYVYTGSGFYGTLLSQYDLSAETEETVDIGSPVLGIAVDQQTGLIYLTTYGDSGETIYDNPPKDRLMIYDSNLTKVQWESGDIGNPAGVAIAGNVSYKPPVFDLAKDDNDIDCASPLISEAEHEMFGTPYNWLYYNIEYDANGFADTNVIITDYLPVEVDYNSSDPYGLYDSNTHTVTWNIGDLSASDSNTLWIQVGVKLDTRPGDTIINLCEMESIQYYKFTTEETTICCYGGNIIYVDQDANGYNIGTSWQDAYTDLQDALDTAQTCGFNQVWVAEGTYIPTDTKNRSISFDLVDDVAVYGGFPHGGGQWADRDPNAHETILSGDIGTPNDLSDNSYHVVKCEGVNNVILDGFTITAGNADGADANTQGGGIYDYNSSSLMIANCTFIDNSAHYGGGMYNEFSTANLINCNFTDNTVVYGGGSGMYNNQACPTLTNCIFTGNKSTSTFSDGGGMYNNQSSPILIDCEFSGNTVVDSGGGMHNYQASPTLIHCIFSNNSSYKGGAVCNYSDSEPNITNCIFTGNNADDYGGGIYNYESTAAVANCFFTGNTAYYYGGGMANKKSISLVTNCTFSGNRVEGFGGGTCNWDDSNSIFTNCIFWDNKAVTGNNEIYSSVNSEISVTYCDVKEGDWEEDNGNINEDPCFFEVDANTGSWTEDATYDSSTFQSTLTNSSANWAVNELAGRFVNPDTLNQHLQFFIVTNDVNTIKVWSDVRTIAISGDPYRIYDYHLKLESACIDAGDPNGDYTGQKDIDGEPRVFDGDDNETEIVDMGADEYYWSPADFNSDGIVNFFDYALLANVWQTTPEDVNYNDIYDLIDNNCIDYNDLARFCEDWLWQTAWAKTFPFAYEQTMGRGMGMSKAVSESLVVTQDPYPSILTKEEPPEVIEVDIEVIVKWLFELWLTDEEVRKMISEDEWLKFIESVIQSLKE